MAKSVVSAFDRKTEEEKENGHQGCPVEETDQSATQSDVCCESRDIPVPSPIGRNPVELEVASEKGSNAELPTLCCDTTSESTRKDSVISKNHKNSYNFSDPCETHQHQHNKVRVTKNRLSSTKNSVTTHTPPCKELYGYSNLMRGLTMLGLGEKSGRGWSTQMLVLVFLTVSCLVGVSITSKVKVHPIFEEERYEIKSCLSPDLESHEQSSCRFYALVIDGGSTGTRIHIFEFSHDNTHPASPFKLEGEVFQEEKPGLSYYANEPEKAAEGVAKLLDKAKRSVPKQMWPHTPLSLKATAGLRLLPADSAERILQAVEDLFRSSPFLLEEESVGVMSGTDEGIFGWFTLNFLLNRIDAVLMKPKELEKAVSENLTAAALDLGGGSTQVTFRPLLVETIENAPPHHSQEVKVFGQNIKLYTHSYLGNGLMAMRLGNMRLKTKAKSKKYRVNQLSLFSDCLPHGFILPWNYSGSLFKVRGGNDYGLERCLLEAKDYVEHTEIHNPLELRTRDLYAFSYFYDRALQAGFVDGTDGGIVTVVDFKTAAYTACQQSDFGPGTEHWRPWQCMDLSYIYVLLSHGYGLPDDKQITLAKKIRSMETSWALGAAYHLLNTYHEERIESGQQGYHKQFARAGFYLCSRVYHGLSHLVNYFQLLA